jgi:heme A synthase
MAAFAHCNAQALLGIVTVLTSPGIVPGHWGVFEWMAQLHQLTGMLLLLSMVWMLYIIRRIITGLLSFVNPGQFQSNRR